MGLTLDVLMKLDAAGFASQAGRIVQSVQSSFQIAVGVMERVKGALDLGGRLSDVAAQIGVTAGEVMILERAYEGAGMSAESLSQTLTIMRKALDGASEDGGSTVDIFRRLKLSADSLKNMTATEQLKTIGNAIMSLGNASERSAASAAVFGRGGSKMLAMFADAGWLTTATETLHSMPARIDRAAGAFDEMSDRMTRIKQNMTYFWVGLVENLLPEIDKVTAVFQGIDFAKHGEKAGEFVSTVLGVIKNGQFAELMESIFEVVKIKVINIAKIMGAEIYLALRNALARPFEEFHMRWNAFWFALKNPEASSQMTNQDWIAKAQKDWGYGKPKMPIEVTLDDSTDAEAKVKAIFDKGKKSAQATIDAIEKTYKKPELGGATLEDSKTGRIQAGRDMQSDALTRVGGSMGAVFAPNMYRIAVETKAIMQTVAQNTAALVGQGRSSVKASYG